ncbi:MAG: hypothetical protein DME08_24610 [Candidatus Rokuibacteriota bacterium]|nr:MAG: hypothetical protein DME08_24610 [Candidatus Rokubacteria bacterium]
MITFMRRYRRTLQIGLLVIVAAFVASLFIFGTSARDGGAARDSVATVNGEKISVERYQRRYQEYLSMYAQMMRDRFSPEMAERMGLPQQVVEDLVLESLAVQKAQGEGLGLTDEELNAQIHTFPAFQEGGRFTLKRYEEVLRRLGYTKGGFEDEMRRRLTRSKVENAVRGGVKVSDSEIEQAYVQQREEARAEWALVELTPLIAAQTATDEELQAYVKPKKARAAHILVRVSETGGSEAEDKAKAKIADVIRRAKAGEDFAKLAREVSEDPGTKDKGGDLGLVGKGEMVPAFEQAVFELKKGDVSPEPVRTPFGYHAIKVSEVQDGGKKPLKEVAAPIRERLQAEAADRGARARADEVRTTLLGAGDFTAEAKKLGLTPHDAMIARKQSGPFAGADTMEEAAFNLSLGGVSAPVKTPAGWVVIKNLELLPAAVPPLTEIRAQVEAGVKRQKAEAVALQKAKQVADEAKHGDFQTAAKKIGAQTAQTPRFSRTKPAERLPGDVMVAALQATAGAITEPVKSQQGYYVVKVLERIPPDPSGLAAERERLERDLLARKQTQAWQSWLNAARAKAKVDVSTQLPARRG